MLLSLAVKYLCYRLRKDNDYRYTWQSNIAMAYTDNWKWYADKTKKEYFNIIDRHTIANNAAKYFLDLLSGKMKIIKNKVSIKI